MNNTHKSTALCLPITLIILNIAISQAPAQPLGATQPAAPVAAASATLNGMTIPNGLPTLAWFEWGPSSAYGQSTERVDVGSGVAVARVSQVVSGLASAAAYHFRLVASNSAGLCPGADCLLTTGCIVTGWGQNGSGQINIPGDLGNVVALSAGAYHSLALRPDGTVRAWGNNAYQQCNVPSDLSNVVAVASGCSGWHCLALKPDGSVRNWGIDLQLHSPPPGLTNAIAIAAGSAHSIALRADGTVLAWGNDDFGQTNVPAGLTNVVAVAGGGYFSMALKADRTVTAWGNNANGETNVPATLSNVVAIAGGEYHGLALRDDGQVFAWGKNDYGQRDVPSDLSNVVAIAAGGEHNAALLPDGTVRVWGSQTSPSGLSNVVLIAAGGWHCLAGSLTNLPAPPAITMQPSSQVTNVGALVVFSVIATGTEPLSYQWCKNGVSLADGGNVSGAATDNLTLSNVFGGDAGGYSVVISSPYGSVTSSVATLSVLLPPAITAQPSSQVVVLGSNATFNVTAVGTAPLEYAWYFNGTNLLQAGTNSMLVVGNVPAEDGGGYSVVITNAYGSVTSSVATLTVGYPPVITIQPTNQLVSAGASVIFSVGVSGVGPFTYQWRFNGTNLPNGIITTVAGNGSSGFSGDGGAAANASLNGPGGVALDTVGNLLIADTYNHRIRRVDTNGIITTLAGNGTSGFSGDGGVATNASLYLPSGVALDVMGNLFIADTDNKRIRRVDTNGIIATVAGTGSSFFSGDGGAATNASLYGPSGVALDAVGNLFIADTYNNRIRKVDTNGIITTVAGNGGFSFSGDGGAATNASLYPSGVALDALGNLFIADAGNNRIRRVDTNGIIATVAGNGSNGFGGDGGAATNASLLFPSGVMLDAVGNLFIADLENNRIRRVDANGIITTVAGNGGTSFSGDGGAATNASIDYPDGVTLDAAGNLFIAELRNNRIRRVLHYGSTLILNNVTVTNAGDYTVIVSSPYGSVTSTVATLLVLLPPAITAQPSSQVVVLGSNAMFNVTAMGTEPLEYAWYLNGTNLLQVGTNSVLEVDSVAPDKAGVYSVVVTNDYGSVTSSVATLTVAYPPSITASSISQAVVAGRNLTLTVGVSGTGPFSYQWQCNGTNLPNEMIETVAGSGSTDFSGDGGTATSAGLHRPNAVPSDAEGNLFIADTYHHSIRRVDTNGIITTVAGNGTNGFSGDGGAATSASLYEPYGLALDAVGNLFIADTYNNRIRRVDTNGIITTVAGNGTNGFSGDGGVAPTASLYNPYGVALNAVGNLLIADTYNNRIRSVDGNGIITTVAGNGASGFSGDGGAATNAALYNTYGVALDAVGNLFIADTYRIRRVNANGVITTVAGNGGFGFSGDGGAATNATLYFPKGEVLDAMGNLFIADLSNHRIRRVDPNGIITTVAGNGSANFSGDGGAATNASLYHPGGVALDAVGNLLIADDDNNRIRRVLLYAPMLILNNITVTNAGDYTVIVSSPYGSITSAVAKLSVLLPPAIIAQPASQIVLLGSNAMFSVTASGTPPMEYAWFYNGTNLLQVGTNSMLEVDNVAPDKGGAYSVVITNAYGSVTSTVARLTVGYPPSITASPVGQAVVTGRSATLTVGVSGTGPFSYQWRFNGTNLPNGIIKTVAGNGSTGFSGDGGAATNARLYYPNAVALDALGNLFIADNYNNRIRRVSTNGIITTVAGNGSTGFSGDGGAATNASLHYPDGVASDAAGNLLIADEWNNRIRKVGTNGVITTVVGNGTNGFSGDGGAAIDARINAPFGLALDTLGDLFIADSGNNCIRKVDTNGIITTVAGNGSAGFSGDGGAATNARLYHPNGVALDVLGNLFIADNYNNRIRRVDTNGIISTVAGNGSWGFSGDGGAATNASVYGPEGMAFEGVGNLFIADTSNHRIRRVDTNGIITTVAGNGGTVYSGDGGAATNASLYFPSGAALDAAGNLFIADTEHNRIRKVLLYASNPTLILNNVTLTNAGDYTVIVSSPYGSVTSSVAVLSVLLPPAITAQPTNRVVVSGSNATFSVAAVGTAPLEYAWYFNATNLIQVGTNSMLAVDNAAEGKAGGYSVVITNAYGSVTSRVATLTVVYPPNITAPPVSQAIVAGRNVTLAVGVSGTGPFTYQWRFNGTNLPNGIITTVAGNGTNSFSGDGGAATSASLYYPIGVALDAVGNLFIADNDNNCIRRVGTNGITLQRLFE